MTKEPKLQAAVRIVAEWTDYDQELKRMQTRVQEGLNHTTKQQSTGTPHSQQPTPHRLRLCITHADVSLPLFLSDGHTEL